MKILPPIAVLGLLFTIVPPALHLLCDLNHKTTMTLMTIGMIIWYCAATPWLTSKNHTKTPR